MAARPGGHEAGEGPGTLEGRLVKAMPQEAAAEPEWASRGRWESG